ncbi:GNAT family N-acetyltransferase [Clostridium sp.]|uniref:GNAT family N-acetyltransferase n=1 Tax=Clostridium sp. TaxID=1506 RepID=UPI003463BE0E
MIKLRKITKENWEQCLMLNPNKSGQVTVVNKFVDSVAYCMVWASMENLTPKAIYDEEELIGFTMYGFCEEVSDYKIYNILIDRNHQGKGYGRNIVNHLIGELKEVPSCSNIYLTFNPENLRAKGLYESLGFENTGKKFRLPEAVRKDIYGEEYDEKNDEYLYSLNIK